MKGLPTEKECIRCEKTKTVDSFYISRGKYVSSICKDCYRKEERLKYHEYKDDNCGGIRILTKPNTFTNNSQKECLFNIMRTIGFQFNEEKGIWWKPGFRDENGIFINVKGRKRRKRQYLTKPMIREMYELFEKNVSVSDIALKFNTHENTIYKYRLKYETSRNRRNRNTT